MINLRLLVSSVAALALAGATASTLDFSYNANGEEPLCYGFDRKETYDVAIRIKDAGLTGAKITKLSVMLPVENADVANLKGWISSELKIGKVDGKQQNVADICTVEAYCDNMTLTAEFPEPYAIPAEGVFVGYSFDIKATGTQQLANPVIVARGQAKDGLWIHTSKSKLKWVSLSEELDAVSTMTVTMEGDFRSDAASASFTDIYVEKSVEGNAVARILNHGTRELQSIDYTVNLAGQTLKGNHTFTEPIAARYGAWRPLEIQLPAVPKTGVYNLSFTIDRVNGQDSPDSGRIIKAKVKVLPFIPVNRPLVEEFTSLGCGYCPRGYVALEEMGAKYGDLFVAMAYHSQLYERGCMVALPDNGFPIKVGGLPSGCINRGDEMDPGMFPYVWNSYTQPVPEGDIKVTLRWDDSDPSCLVAESSTRFIYDMDNAGYRLSFALVADGLSNPKWGQTNYYKGKPAEEYPGKLWDTFINGPGTIYGLTFNDVVVYYPDVNGIKGSLPTIFNEGETYNYTWKINTADVVNILGEPIVEDFDKTRVIGILLDPLGKPVNCFSSGYPIVSGVNTLTDHCDIVATEYYDMMGGRIDDDFKGMCIRLDRMADGSHKSMKIIR